MALRIEIEELNGSGIYAVTFEGRDLCRSATPFVTAARCLLSEGRDPSSILEMSRRGADRVDLRSTLEYAADLIFAAGSLRYAEKATDGSPGRSVRFRLSDT